jgi:transglutaminase-like putative cysteine protease
MRYQIQHQTDYHYDRPVTLQPHVLRLQPRSGAEQTLLEYQLDITPTPTGISQCNDLEGNIITKIWFEPTQTLDHLQIKANSVVETHWQNPFEYQLESWVLQLPIDYPSSLSQQLQPYLNGSPDHVCQELAQSLGVETDGQIQNFLFRLNSLIYQECEQILRLDGPPWPPSVTWTKKSGACRDVVTLFMGICRAIGLAARFVSGYQEGDPDMSHRQLHAWVEVYLPGAGWRGYDPTHGLVVADRHIAIAASIHPQSTMPISGGINLADGQKIPSTLTHQITLNET